MASARDQYGNLKILVKCQVFVKNKRFQFVPICSGVATAERVLHVALVNVPEMVTQGFLYTAVQFKGPFSSLKEQKYDLIN